MIQATPQHSTAQRAFARIRSIWRRCHSALFLPPVGAPQPASPTSGTPPCPAPTKDEATTVVRHMYELALHRTPTPEDLQVWVDEATTQRSTLARIVETIARSPEADEVRTRGNLLPSVPNGEFIYFCYDTLLSRSPLLPELIDWDHRLKTQTSNRAQFALQLFTHRAYAHFAPSTFTSVHDPNLIPWMGTDKLISIMEWKQKALDVGGVYAPFEANTYSALSFKRNPEILVSAVASLYRGGEYIEQFLDNITSQTIFRDQCELIIVDADSPENEHETIARYMERYPNIVYHRVSTRIGIYDAWNVGVRMARGKYITNTNMDDLRRVDSFERQVEILEKFPFVDVTYQDFFYSFEGHAPFDFSACVGFKSALPVVTPCNLMQSNSPHNAPMWRRELHDDVGMFDESFRSAGDYDFWLRCVLKGKVFYKCNDPHVIYFVNPEGLSTQADTRGIVEAQRITQMHGSKLISRHLLSSDEQFLDELRYASSAEITLPDTERNSPHWRYAAAQQALRGYSITMRARGH